MKSISVIGLGKVGSCMAAVYASKGFKVVGVDVDKDKIDFINSGKAPVEENNLDKLIKKNSNNLRATDDYKDAVLNTRITFIVVPTPSDKTGGFSLDYVVKACKQIGKVLAHKDDYHLVVLTSTVLPGDSEEKIIPVLEQSSKKKCGKNFGYCYSPGFIALGSVIHNLLRPEFYLIGQHDDKSGQLLKNFYSYICNNNAPVELMNIPSAELAKISLNTYITTKITFANMLAEICEKIPSVDVDKVTGALGKDKRIGSYYFKGGLGFGGPCFPRDNVAFAYAASKYNCKAPMAKLVHSYNKKLVERVINIVLANISKNKKIGFFGLAYKQGTPVVEESHALKVVKKLVSLGYKIFVYEPAGYEQAKKELKDKVKYCQDLRECLESSDIYFISYITKEFNLISKFLQKKANKTIIDPWRLLKNNSFNDSINYIALGLGK